MSDWWVGLLVVTGFLLFVVGILSLAFSADKKVEIRDGDCIIVERHDNRFFGEGRRTVERWCKQ